MFDMYRWRAESKLPFRCGSLAMTAAGASFGPPAERAARVGTLRFGLFVMALDFRSDAAIQTVRSFVRAS